jgi:hypothetical protein
LFLFAGFYETINEAVATVVQLYTVVRAGGAGSTSGLVGCEGRRQYIDLPLPRPLIGPKQ